VGAEDGVLGGDRLGRPEDVPHVGVRATIRSVFRSPPPPIITGKCGWTGRGRDPEVVERVAATGITRDLIAVEQGSAPAGTASASQSRRWPNPDPKSMPKA
jgi:hypothetical protein